MSDILLTVSQALQLVALAPCIFVVAFLLSSAKRGGQAVVPILYFLSLACSFIIPLLPIFGDLAENAKLKAGLLLGESLTVAFSYLLIVQFLLSRVPQPLYWLVLTIPLIGGSPFIYVTSFASEVCLDAQYCLQTESLRMLYNIIGTCLVFLMIIVQFSRSSARIAADDTDRKHKYWLVIALILMNLLLVGLQLMYLAENITAADVLFAGTVVRIAFIYLVLTSIFRVFYELFEFESLVTSATPASVRTLEQDKQLVERIRQLMEGEHIYREMGLSREGLARRLSISEHQTSRIINAHFQKSFNELVNTYRIEEAKERLKTEDTQVTVIAFEVGFSSIASFNRVFKDLAGASPTEFRNFHKNRVI